MTTNDQAALEREQARRREAVRQFILFLDSYYTRYFADLGRTTGLPPIDGFPFLQYAQVAVMFALAVNLQYYKLVDYVATNIRMDASPDENLKHFLETFFSDFTLADANPGKLTVPEGERILAKFQKIFAAPVAA